MSDSAPPPGRPAPRRSRAVLALLALFAIFQGTILWSNANLFSRHHPGFVVHYDKDAKKCVHAVTDEAHRAKGDLRDDPYIISVNGEPVTESMLPLDVASMMRSEAGSVNHIELEDNFGGAVAADVPVGRPTYKAIFHTAATYFHLMGLLYLAIGLLVWWRRPEDPDRAGVPASASS